MYLLSTLGQPYLYYYSRKGLLKRSLFIFSFFFLFTYFFEPFDVNISEQKFDFYLICAIHGLLASLILYFYSGIISIFSVEDKWTLGKEISFLTGLLFIIGLGNFLIRSFIYNNSENLSFHYLGEELTHTLLVGLLLILIAVPLNFIRLYNKNNKEAATFEDVSRNTDIGSLSKPVSITTQTFADNFDFEVENFVYAKAAGNYVEFIFTIDGNVNTELKRISLKELEEQLRMFPAIMKTHRSYLINVQKIEKVTGNAQGYYLKMPNIKEQLPVSRGRLEYFTNAFRQFQQGAL